MNILTNQINYKKQGDVGLGIAIGYFVSLGFTVNIPLTDSQNYDIIIDDGTLKKVQVKTTNHISNYGIYKVGLKTCGGNRSGIGKVKKLNTTELDILFILTGNGDKYSIPLNIFNGKELSQLSLDKKYQKYKILN